MIEKCKAGLDKIYRSFDYIDLDDKNNRFILKLVLVNFVKVRLHLFYLGFRYHCTGYLFGDPVFDLWKYFNDLKAKYAILLKATNQMAEGNLVCGDHRRFLESSPHLRRRWKRFARASNWRWTKK